MKEMYKDEKYAIYHTNDGYLIHNYSLPGFAHTHIRNYGTALKLVELSKKHKCPMDLPRYLVISHYRLAEDGEYKSRVEQIMSMRKRSSYRNDRVGIACRA